MKLSAKLLFCFLLSCAGLLDAASSTNQSLVINTNSGRLANFTNFFAANTNLSVPVDSLFFAPLLHTHAAADITSGTIDPARLGSGASITTKYLRGDSTWQTITTGSGDALVANPLSQFAATTSAQLRGVISDETGSGAAVFADSPSLITPSATTLSVSSNGTASSPSIVFSGRGANWGLYSPTASSIGFSLGGSVAHQFWNDGSLYLQNNNAIFALGASSDAIIQRDAANTLAQRNGVNAQSFRLYNTYTDASNYERGVLDWGTAANTLTIGTQKAGTGSTRAINFVVGGVNPFSISTAGHFLAGTDNTYDIGASGANRPRDGYFGNTVYAGGGFSALSLGYRSVAAGYFFWDSRSAMSSPADGRILISDNAATSFDRLQFGGITASFPSLKRSSTALQVRLADDSGLAPLDAGAVSATTLTLSGAVTFPAGTRQTFAPNTTTPGINVGSVASDPSTPSNGDLWLNSTTGRMRTRVGGASVDVATGATQDFELTTITSGASIAIDLNATQYQTLTLATDATTVTTSNRSASKGRATTIFVLASGAQRTFTLNASWRNFNGGSTSVVIPSGKEASISLFCTGSAETDVRVVYTIQP